MIKRLCRPWKWVEIAPISSSSRRLYSCLLPNSMARHIWHYLCHSQPLCHHQEPGAHPPKPGANPGLLHSGSKCCYVWHTCRCWAQEQYSPVQSSPDFKVILQLVQLMWIVNMSKGKDLGIQNMMVLWLLTLIGLYYPILFWSHIKTHLITYTNQ